VSRVVACKSADLGLVEPRAAFRALASARAALPPDLDHAVERFALAAAG
jgi:hypothetical protein